MHPNTTSSLLEVGPIPSSSHSIAHSPLSGGTAACVAAGRLAAADPSLKILILEAGPTTYNNLAHIQPARYLSHLAPDSTTVTHNIAKPSTHLGGRAVVVSSGHCLGGGSSVNFMLYTRASASDYDDWETKYSNPGWGSKELIPLLEKSETYQTKKGQAIHGYSGPLKVSLNKIPSNITQDFMDVLAQYGSNVKKTDDANDLKSVNVFARWSRYDTISSSANRVLLTSDRWIDGDTGRRSDIPHNMIYPLLGKSALEVQTQCLVKKVIIEDGRAVGVEYVPNKRMDPGAPQRVIVARASQLVVVSAGAFGSPTILERSGIGAKARLDQLGVKVYADLPGVGEAYQDHIFLPMPFLASGDSVTLDKLIVNDPEEVEKWMAQWNKNGSGLLASTGFDGASKFRPTQEELRVIGSEFDARWKQHFVPAPDKPVLVMGSAALYLGLPVGLLYDKFFSIPYFVGYPTSVGYVHISSAEDIYAAPDFDPGFLQSDDDLALLVWGYKKGREYARRMTCYRGEYLPNHPTFPEGSAAVCQEHTIPVPINAPDIHYTSTDDEAIKAHVRASVSSAWHSLGTCSMKPRQEGGVVDPQLNVYGIRSLKVVDMSIAPGNVGANTYSTAITIGEKAALITASELGISGV
ncbi:hypothetical protein NLI96_g11571 [Meripilus lineatus]|uniref:Glucose-methanol-choline oxidoreductase N-terminal domain-containing protein n=1 Tax=Meripilus lineatus TaxID=2056292 RepID=A0AAD5URJ0_9APHY|nr:hypothetical protein NLI96_g11571 [Physisporinus lineatus]